MAARITRGKKKIVAAGVPFAVPDATALPLRLSVVAQTAYLAFTAGYAPGSGDRLVRSDLAGEAIRLVRVTLGLRPDEPVLRSLLALMLLQHSRRDARVDGAGALVLLPDQDRSSWHHEEIEEALDLLRRLPPDPESLAESYRPGGGRVRAGRTRGGAPCAGRAGARDARESPDAGGARRAARAGWSGG